MSEHLPDCFDEMTGVCICDRLRACEQRMREHEGCDEAGRAEGYSEGYRQGREDEQEKWSPLFAAIIASAAEGNNQAAVSMQRLEPQFEYGLPVMQPEGDGRYVDIEDALAFNNAVLDAITEVVTMLEGLRP